MGLHIQPNMYVLQKLMGMEISSISGWHADRLVFPISSSLEYRAGFFGWFIDDIEIYTCHDHTSLRHTPNPAMVSL